MVRNTFHQENQEVKNEVLLLGSMLEDAMLNSVQALKDADLARSQCIIAEDKLINRKSYEIGIFIVMLMATQQSIARDLRILTSSFGICSESERIDHYAKGIASINIRSEGWDIQKSCGMCTAGTKNQWICFTAHDILCDEDFQGAAEIIKEDDWIDE